MRTKTFSSESPSWALIDCLITVRHCVPLLQFFCSFFVYSQVKRSYALINHTMRRAWFFGKETLIFFLFKTIRCSLGLNTKLYKSETAALWLWLIFFGMILEVNVRQPLITIRKKNKLPCWLQCVLHMYCTTCYFRTKCGARNPHKCVSPFKLRVCIKLWTLASISAILFDEPRRSNSITCTSVYIRMLGNFGSDFCLSAQSATVRL